MTARLKTLLVWSVLLLIAKQSFAAAATARLSRKSDSYFMEDDQAYSRFLWFQANGSYRQINRNSTAAEEVDRGTWEQAASGEVALHPTDGMLTFRALSSGSLLVVLATQAQMDTLAALQTRITAFLTENQDTVFARSALHDLVEDVNASGETDPASGARVELAEHAYTFDRNELEDLLRQVNDWLRSKKTGSITFDLASIPGRPLLLIQKGAVYSRSSLTNLPASTRTGSNDAPHFYFAQVSRGVFLKSAGEWKPFSDLGGLHTQAPVRRVVP